MSTDQEKSFIAAVNVKDFRFNLLHNMRNRAVFETRPYSGGFFTGSPQGKNISHLLSLFSLVEKKQPSLLLYFKYSDHAYTLYVQSPCPYTGYCISKSEAGFFGAFPLTNDVTTFRILNRTGSAVTLDKLTADTQSVYLEARRSGPLRLRDTGPRSLNHIHDKEGSLVTFELTILVRNAPFLLSRYEG